MPEIGCGADQVYFSGLAVPANLILVKNISVIGVVWGRAGRTRPPP